MVERLCVIEEDRSGWTFPEDVRGWLTPTEGRGLAELARGKAVLEIGSFEGRSTISMAQHALSVTCVDTFMRTADPEGPEDTFPAFTENVARYKLDAKITAIRGPSAVMVPKMSGCFDFDLAFIDAAHDYESVMRDARMADALVKPGGRLAFHDYRVFPGEHDDRWDPGVNKAVDELLRDGFYLQGRHGSVAVLGRKAERPPPPAHEEQRFYLALPRRPGEMAQEPGGKVEITVPTRRGTVRVGRGAPPSLNWCFNQLWASALNYRKADGITHFGMQHYDVKAPPAWADVLVDLLHEHDADVMSAVIPIKDHRGLTSTCLRNAATGDMKRLTMTEIMELPETFDLAQVQRYVGKAEDGDLLAVNTGLWVCRFTEGWVEPPLFPGFFSADKIVRLESEDGREKFVAAYLSEDWCFSEWASRHGLRVMATRKVPLAHLDLDGTEYRNDYAWGTYRLDPGDREDDAKGPRPGPRPTVTTEMVR